MEDTNKVIPPIVCSREGCQRKGWWVEDDENGERVFCFRTRHDGQKDTVRFTREQFEAAMSEEQSPL